MVKLSDVALALQLQAEAVPDRPDVTVIHRTAATNRWRSTAGEEWRRGRLLGEGGFGQVYLEECISGGNVGHVRAVKRLQKAKNENYYHELNALALFSLGKYRDSFVACFGWYATDSHIFFSMEYLPHGDLQQYLDQPLLEREGQLIMTQILVALEYMHERNFTHRDLKPGNILIATPRPDWWIKIADFGISKRTEDGLTSLRTAKGTQKFVAPEVLLSDDESPYTNAVDIWSAGMILFLVLTGMPNMNFTSMLRYSVRVEKSFPDQPLIAQGISPDGRSFVQELLQCDAKDRPSATKALQHNWLNPTIDISQNVQTVLMQDYQRSDAETNIMSSQSQAPSADNRVVLTSRSTGSLIPTAQWSTTQSRPGESFGAEDTVVPISPQALMTTKSHSDLSEADSLQHRRDTHNTAHASTMFQSIVDAEPFGSSNHKDTRDILQDRSIKVEPPAIQATWSMGSYTFRWEHPAEEVFVTGTFDDWGKSVKLDKVGSAYEKTVDLPKSDDKILYKFVANGDWQHDPSQKFEQDMHGNTNNVLYPDDIKVNMNHKTTRHVSQDKPVAVKVSVDKKLSRLELLLKDLHSNVFRSKLLGALGMPVDLPCLLSWGFETGGDLYPLHERQPESFKGMIEAANAKGEVHVEVRRLRYGGYVAGDDVPPVSRGDAHGETGTRPTSNISPMSPKSAPARQRTQEWNTAIQHNYSGDAQAGSNHDNNYASQTDATKTRVAGSLTTPQTVSKLSQARVLQAYDTTRERGRYGEMVRAKRGQEVQKAGEAEVATGRVGPPTARSPKYELVSQPSNSEPSDGEDTRIATSDRSAGRASHLSASGSDKSSSKPIYLKGLFSVSATTGKPFSYIRADIIRVLRQLSIDFEEIIGGFACRHTVRNVPGEENHMQELQRRFREDNLAYWSTLTLRFEVLVVKVPVVSLHGIQFKMIDGEDWHYKNVAQTILKELKL